MVRFKDISKEDLEALPGRGRRGGISWPICKAFLDTGKYMVEVDLEDLGRTVDQIAPTLMSYIKKHRLPIRVIRRSGRMFLQRLDVDEEGNIIQWPPPEEEVPPIELA